MGLPTILFLIFLVLKLTNQIDWSWWWVTAPLWIEFIIGVIVFALFGGLAARGSKSARRALRNSTYRNSQW